MNNGVRYALLNFTSANLYDCFDFLMYGDGKLNRRLEVIVIHFFCPSASGVILPPHPPCQPREAIHLSNLHASAMSSDSLELPACHPPRSSFITMRGPSSSCRQREWRIFLGPNIIDP